MGAPDLIFELRRKGYSIIADGTCLDISSAENLPDKFVQQLRQNKSAILNELKREARRQKVLTILKKNLDKQRAVYVDTESNQDNVVLAIAVRNLATCEMLIPKNRYDPFLLLSYMDNEDRIH